MLNFVLKYKFSISWALVILFLCTVRISDGQPYIIDFFYAAEDKLVHFVLFQVQTLLMVLESKVLRDLSAYGFRYIFRFFIINIIYGGVIELLQWKVFTYRSPDFWDWIVDSFGSAVAITYIFLARLHFKINNNK